MDINLLDASLKMSEVNLKGEIAMVAREEKLDEF